jgi:hypothetical protein
MLGCGDVGGSSKQDVPANMDKERHGYLLSRRVCELSDVPTIENILRNECIDH